MFRRILPFVLIAIAVSAVIGIVFASQRMQLTCPAFERFTKKTTDVPVEPETAA